MAITSIIPKVLITKSTPHRLFYLLFHVFVFHTTLSIGLNVTDLFSSFSNLSQFNALLTATGVSSDIALRSSSITLLAVPNSLLRPPATTPPDLLRLHVITQYLSSSDLHRLPTAGAVFPTLLPSTPVNATTDPETKRVTFHSPISNATLLDDTVRDLSPGKIRVLLIDTLLLPYNFDDLTASETRPPAGLNITRALIDGHDFNVAASMLAASGVVSEFEADEAGAGITMFVPTDTAFADLPSSGRFQSLPADKKATVLKFHVLHSYYPLGSLEDIVNPIYPTLATEQNVAGSFTVNITKVNGSVAIGTGVVVATVTQTVFDQNPVSIFEVSKVLLPKEFFGSNPIDVSNNYTPPAIVNVAAPALPPYGGPGGSRLTADPPGMNARSLAMMHRSEVGVLRVLLNLCIGGGFMLL